MHEWGVWGKWYQYSLYPESPCSSTSGPKALPDTEAPLDVVYFVHIQYMSTEHTNIYIHTCTCTWHSSIHAVATLPSAVAATYFCGYVCTFGVYHTRHIQSCWFERYPGIPGRMWLLHNLDGVGERRGGEREKERERTGHHRGWVEGNVGGFWLWYSEVSHQCGYV